ncbi:melanocortin receptor 4-like [Acanthaster planci]|uniref:Melanocortin receptor 4-like n=1 Tax=Acanthaster planci TaxID=133434 RepID=A0A8B7YNI2_ACAPL|nr:melanocortin receptor 4-like [Acanthaster planci]
MKFVIFLWFSVLHEKAPLVTMELTESLWTISSVNASTEKVTENGASHTPFAVFVTILATLAIATNFLLNPLMLFTLRRVTSIQPTTKIFMTSLTLSDFCNGVFWVFKLTELYAGKWVLGDFLCAVSGVTVNAFHTLGIFSLLLLTVDRYIAISWSLRYTQLMTVRKARVTVSATWATAFILCLLLFGLYDHKVVSSESPHFCIRKTYKDWRVYIAILLISISLVTIFIIYAHVLVIARRHSKQIAAEVSSNQHGRRMLHMVNVRSITTIAIITGTLIITWVPCTIMLSILASQETMEYNDSFYAVVLSNVLLMSNSWLNVIIYYLRNRDLQQTLCSLLSNLCYSSKS